VACQTCHDPAQGFSDGNPRTVGVGGLVGRRNSPTIVNRVYSTSQFLDSRAGNLEAQVLGPFTNPAEMAQPSLQAVLNILNSDLNYRSLLTAAGYSAATPTAIAESLASYVRSLEAGGSPVDLYRAGSGGLSTSEEAGLLLFYGKARCAGCHFGPNFSDEELHTSSQDDPVSGLVDQGAFELAGRNALKEAFKTPTLRNIDLSGPYFHDGSGVDLQAVLDQYLQGGRGDGLHDPEISPLDLNPTEQAQLLDFLRALTSPRDPSTAGPAIQQPWP
jgi:cytochrome c peroxidase